MQAAPLVLAINREAADADDAFDHVVRHTEAQLLRISYRMLGNWADAEDVAQEAFLRLHKHGLHFGDEAALDAWLYRVAVNLCIDRCRRLRPAGELPDLKSDHPSAEAELLRCESKQRLMLALAALPPKERAAVVLREIEGVSTAEVAAALGSSEGTVRSQVSKALTRLRTLLNKEAR
jgi:RNA polymerase sigma-70 factor, ECF subfamily